MTPEQAKRILNIAEEDDRADIRRKYHRLMSAFHPDAVGADKPEYIRRAQEINAAYTVLKQAAKTPVSKKEKRKWQGEVNVKAFCDRNIYLYYSMDAAEEKLYYQETRGKYMWNPDEEEFELFLVSIRHASRELLEQVEEMISDGVRVFLREDDTSFEAERFRFQARLFHSLSMQYVHPAATLRKIAGPLKKDGLGREIYRFRAFLAVEGQNQHAREAAGLKAGDILYPASFQGNKIRVMDGKRNSLGYLSLEDDELYFCVIPLLKRRLAQVKMTVKEAKADRRARAFRTRAEIVFYLRVEREADDCSGSDLYLETADILRQYELFLKAEQENRKQRDWNRKI